MARQYAVEWEEVKFINGYAVFMGYLMMGVRGLGLLIITWTTVVLLGGFVSNLEKNDFWCLTVITLIQVAGVFNFLLSEKFGDMVHLSWGLLGAAVGTVVKGKAEDDQQISNRRVLFAFAVSAIQGVVLFVVLCPVAILYVFGLGISAGASLWRLIKHDFGDDGGANKKPALQVLYSLAVAQGVLFGYKIIHAFLAKGGLVKLVYYQLDKRVQEKLIAEYLEETVAGCEKDLSFATGRNLVTYGVDLMMEAKSSEGFIAGIKVLGGAIGCAEKGRKVLAKYLLTRSDDSSTSIVQRLLETVGPRSPYSREIKEHVVRILDFIGPSIRLEQFPRAIECLCSVVYTSGPWNSEQWNYYDGDYGAHHLVDAYEQYYIKYEHRIGSHDDFGCILLKKLFPCLRLKKLFQCLRCKRKDEVEIEREENTRRGMDQLLIRATDIIYKLVACHDNMWILRTCVSNTVLCKIATLPLKLHKDNIHDPVATFPCCPGSWSGSGNSELKMLEQCWVLTERLLIALQPAATPVCEGRQRRREENNQEIEEVEEDGNKSYLEHDMLLLRCSIQSTIKSIFECLDCSVIQKVEAIRFLLLLSLDMSLIKDSESNKRRLSWILLVILCSTGDDHYWTVAGLTYPNNYTCEFRGILRLAGEQLSEIIREKHELPSDESARELQSVHLALEDLKSAFFDDSEDISIRTYAITIMQGLWVDFNSYSEVYKFLRDAFPKVVKETLILCEPETEVTDVKQGRLQNALVSFCHHTQHVGALSYEFKEIASKTCEERGKSFVDFCRLINQFISNTHSRS